MEASAQKGFDYKGTPSKIQAAAVFIAWHQQRAVSIRTGGLPMLTLIKPRPKNAQHSRAAGTDAVSVVAKWLPVALDPRGKEG